MFVCDCMNMSTRLWWREKKATRKSKAFLMSVWTSIITKHIHTKMTMTPNGPTEWHPDRIAAKITQAMEHTVYCWRFWFANHCDKVLLTHWNTLYAYKACHLSCLEIQQRNGRIIRVAKCNEWHTHSVA